MYDIIVFVACFVVGYSITNRLIESLLVALIVTAIYSHFLHNRIHVRTYEGMKSGSGKSVGKPKSKSRGKKAMKKFVKQRRFKKDHYNFDPNASLQETYKSLSNGEALGLNKDTKELIKTQQQLMSTLQDMGPVLEQGKSIIGAFDSFFKDGGTKKQDLAYMRKRLGIGDLPESEVDKMVSDGNNDNIDTATTKPLIKAP